MPGMRRLEADDVLAELRFTEPAWQFVPEYAAAFGGLEMRSPMERMTGELGATLAGYDKNEP